MDEEELRQNIASLEGEVMALRMVTAMLIYSARHSIPFEVVYTETSLKRQLFGEDLQTSFPDARLYFIQGFRSGFDIQGLVDAIGEIMDGR